MDPYQPLRLASAHKDLAVETLVRAYDLDPLSVYVLPDAKQRECHLGRFFRAVLNYAYHYGEVYTVAAVEGVACWLAPGGAEPTLWRLLRTRFGLPLSVLRLPSEPRRRMAALMNYNDEVHRRVVDRPHWYLAAIGVAPPHQRRGIGGRLLGPVLARADATGVPCYLETPSPANVSFYGRHGFAVVNEGEVPGHGQKMWAMLREARRDQEATAGQ